MSPAIALPEVIENDVGLMTDAEMQEHALETSHGAISAHVQRRTASFRSACVLVLCLTGLATGATREAMQAACPDLAVPTEASLLTLSAIMLRRFLNGFANDKQIKHMIEQFPDEMKLAILEEHAAAQDNETKAVLRGLLLSYFPQFEHAEVSVAREFTSLESLPAFAA